jgi:hypothetical protein
VTSRKTIANARCEGNSNRSASGPAVDGLIKSHRYAASFGPMVRLRFFLGCRGGCLFTAIFGVTWMHGPVEGLTIENLGRDTGYRWRNEG